MPILAGEVFGPAVPIVRAVDSDDAIRLASATRFGLGSSLWTSSLTCGVQLALRLALGHTAINGMTVQIGGFRSVA